MNIIRELLIGCVFITALTAERVVPHMSCLDSGLVIRVSALPDRPVPELEKWSAIKECQFSREGEFYVLKLARKPDVSCGITKIVNKLTGATLFYHKVSTTSPSGIRTVHKVVCSPTPPTQSNIVKRDILPPHFIEPAVVNITEVTGSAPIAELSAAVRQNGRLIGSAVTVSPGAALIMEVSLDLKSTSTYGILVSGLDVTDGEDKRETIIFNGCTADQYVFENFKTSNGDIVTAKFRAFKFPESNYLYFTGTVDVCLDKCKGIQCSNGEIGYGRRRCAIPDGAHSNKIFEVTMMTFIRVDEQKNDKEFDASPFIRQGFSSSQRVPSTSFDREKEFNPMSSSSDNYNGDYGSPPFSLFHVAAASYVSSSWCLLLLPLYMCLVALS